MVIEGASMTIPVPSIITSSPSGGRFDFDDGGTYCGGWQDGKAHGHGICTGPKNVGEYSGSWNFGFEMSGVYKWKNGAVYEGRWQNGKRHGVGVEYNGKWIYKGEWSQGFKGRYGVKASSNSAVKYEGTWANGLQDGYGSETYSDGGYYQGQMCRGLRHGYGVRKSAPYGDSQLNNPNKNGGPLTAAGLTTSTLIHSNSLQSQGSVDLEDDSPKPEDGFKPNIDRTLASKNGFVLVAKPLDVPIQQVGSGSGSSSGHGLGSKFNISSSNNNNGDTSGPNQAASKSSGGRRNSLTNKLASARIPGSNQTVSLLKNLRLRKQKSTSDLDNITGGGRNTPGGAGAGSDARGRGGADDGTPVVPFTLSPEELDITDPTTVETYTGEWKHDKRNGHGVCERSDGLRYEGQWHNDMKCGYGVTTFKNGNKEEGKYKNNILIIDSKVKRFFQLGSTNIRQRIDDSVKMAQQAQTMSLKKAEIAETRAATARDKADQATTAALEADRDSQIAYSVARQYSDAQMQQLGAMQQQHLVHLNQGNSMGLSQQQQQQQQQMMIMGAGGDPVMPNLGMTSSSLQMRRMSQQQLQLQQHQNQQFNDQQYESSSQLQQQQQPQDPNQRQMMMMNDINMGMNMNMGGMIPGDPNLQQQVQMEPHHHQQQHYVNSAGGIEPFNGRRGSFRGGSQPPHGQGGHHHHHGAGSFHTNRMMSHHHNQAQNFNRQSSTDPFNDLFDHYKSSPGGSQMMIGPSVGTRRHPLSKQTSLDYNIHMRGASVPRQLGGGGGNQMERPGSSRLRRLGGMSSMDHADENRNDSMKVSPNDPSLQQDMSRDSDMSVQQQQFKHLVTSSEDLQSSNANHHKHHQSKTGQERDGATNDMAPPPSNGAPTPTGSSYILPQSTSSSFYGNQTPSPETLGYQRPPSGSQYYGQQHQHQQQQQQPVQGYPNQAPSRFQQAQYPPPIIMHQGNMMKHRDVHSLADEQLYMAGIRKQDRSSLDRTDYANYDFTISTAPRPVSRCMRRTASLSRHTPLSQELRAQLSKSAISQATQSNKHHQQQRSGSPTLLQATGNAPRQTIHHETQHHQIPILTTTTAAGQQTGGGFNAMPMANHHHHTNHYPTEGIPTSNSSHLTLDSAASSSMGALIRKPSLQVRYDPLELGGLMSREEVAAMSHAQREQKRLEAEMAEKRAKRPLLHLYLSLKEFLTRQKLLISLLIFNVCLFKMFADLIV